MAGSKQKKAKAFAEVLKRQGVCCPVCEKARGDAPTWFNQALNEFYGHERHFEFFCNLRSDVKQAIVKVQQLVSTLGHLKDSVEAPHEKPDHYCAGIIEDGIFQSVELLNRSLVHLAIGDRITAFPLTRMAVEVAVRSAFEQCLFYYLANPAKRLPRAGKGEKSLQVTAYLEACRRWIKTSILEEDVIACARRMEVLDWPDEEVSSQKLDPFSLGWGKTVTYLEELNVLTPSLSANLERLYGKFSEVVHQRRTSIDKQSDDDRDEEVESQIIRGIAPTEPSVEQIKLVQEAVDLIIALPIRARIAVGIPLGGFFDSDFTPKGIRRKEAGEEWHRKWQGAFKTWPHLMPQATTAFTELKSQFDMARVTKKIAAVVPPPASHGPGNTPLS